MTFFRLSNLMLNRSNRNSVNVDLMGITDKLNNEMGSSFIIDDLFYEETRLFGMSDNSPFIRRNILPTIPFLKRKIVSFGTHGSKVPLEDEVVKAGLPSVMYP